MPAHDADHFAPDSERLLRTFGGWQREWDAAPIQENATYKAQVDYAVSRIKAGANPIQARWDLAAEFGERCQLNRVLAAAYREIKDAASLPPDVARAVIAIQRQEAIQGAMADGAWGPAMSGLARAGEVAGELSGEVGLSPDDLRLVVEIEVEATEVKETETV